MTQSEKQPLFTIIIPTKDRADYLHHSLRTCLEQDYDNLEIIVSDDGSCDNTREVTESAARIDSRVKYVSPGSSVGMRDNFEFALQKVRPGFVMALGGDDGLLPNGIRGMLAVLEETGQDLLAWPAPMYAYAGARTTTSQLVLHRNVGDSKIVSSSTFLERQTRNLHYLSDIQSPMFYVKGISSTRLIERVRARSSNRRFYACATPDGYSGIVLAGEVATFAFSQTPFSIFGTSPTSQGLGYLGNDQEAKIRSESFFQQVSNRPMHHQLASQPYSPLITLMTADYLLSAQDLPGWAGRFPPINYRNLLVKALGELAHGLYAEARIVRELRILDHIAELHGLKEFFRRQVASTRRYMKKCPFEGNGISPTLLFIDGTKFGVNNIFDAAYAAHFYHNFSTKVSAPLIIEALANSLTYRLQSVRKGEPFPSDVEWQSDSR